MINSSQKIVDFFFLLEITCFDVAVLIAIIQTCLVTVFNILQNCFFSTNERKVKGFLVKKIYVFFLNNIYIGKAWKQGSLIARMNTISD